MRAPERLWPVSGGRRRARRSSEPRLCATPGCGTRLSVYNEGDHCALHDKRESPAGRQA
ncbi:MAG TPA: hypothetical protein VGI06_01170 [Acidimicrobiales bacterium]